MSVPQHELRDAFPPRSLEPELLADSTGLWTTYPDRRAFEAGCQGRSWDELAPEFVEEHDDALRWMNQPAFAAFLPAYLASLLRGDTSNALPAMVLLQLTRREGWEETFDARAAQLTSTHRAAIVRVLEALAHGERFSHYRQEIEAALASWKREVPPRRPTHGADSG